MATGRGSSIKGLRCDECDSVADSVRLIFGNSEGRHEKEQLDKVYTLTKKLDQSRASYSTKN